MSTGHMHIGKAAAAKRKLDLPGGDYCYLEVSDTGCGMSPTAQTRVFDPFYSTKFVGRGLGLAVVQGILRSHGGGISVMSQPGRGSTFQVLLPRAGKRVREMQEPDTEFEDPGRALCRGRGVQRLLNLARGVTSSETRP